MLFYLPSTEALAMRRAASKQDAIAMFVAWAVTVKYHLSEPELLLNRS